MSDFQKLFFAMSKSNRIYFGEEPEENDSNDDSNDSNNNAKLFSCLPTSG